MTRIIFNGQEYDSPEAMPPDVRNAYQVMLEQLQDKDKDGIPDVFQGGNPGNNVLGMVQTSVTFDGRTFDSKGLPAPVQQLIANVLAHGMSKAATPTQPHGDEPLLRTLDQASRTTEGLLGVLLAFAAGFVLVFGLVLMVAIGGGPELLKERLIVAIAALLILGGIDTKATRLARRRQPLLGPDTAGFRRFVVWSSLGLLIAAVMLLGLAWFLP